MKGKSFQAYYSFPKILNSSFTIILDMGQVGVSTKRALEKKYKHVLASRDLIDDALDLDKRLKQLSTHLRNFEKDLDPFKDTDHKKVRDLKDQ